jgi:hypothetical protein
MNPNVSYKLWVIMMYQWKFISYYKWTTLVEEVDSRRAWGGAGNIWELFVPSAQFCFEKVS